MLVSLSLPLSVFAQSIMINEIAWPVNVAYATNGLKMGTVIINEVAWMGSSSIAGVDPRQWWRYEWAELYNPGAQNIPLDGWILTLYKGEELYFSVPLAGSITAQGYFLIGASDKILGVDVNYSNLGGKFLNTGMRVLLKDNAENIVDEVDPVRSEASNSWPGGDNKTKQTMERVVVSDTAQPDTASLWQTSKGSGGTPKAPNSEGVDSTLVELSYPRLGSTKDEFSPTKDGTEKDLSGSSSLSFSQSQQFESRVPFVNPITLLAGFLALGLSGVLLLVKRSLALRQRSGQALRRERHRT